MLEELISALDRVRLASVITVIAAIGGLYALITGQITYVEFGAGLGAASLGAGAVGQVRNNAGHGTD